MRIWALLVGVVLFVSACSSTQAPPVRVVTTPCPIPGFHDLDASDAGCHEPKEWPELRFESINGHGTTYIIYDTPVTAWPSKELRGIVRSYPHTHFDIYRYADGNDIVAIEVSDVCHVEGWDGHTVNLGCSSTDLSRFQTITERDAVTLLSQQTVDGLKENAARQQAQQVIYAFRVVTPDPIQPDGRPAG